MAQFQPHEIFGKWNRGYALDVHTLSSIPAGEDEFGHPQFDTTRSEIGELLYRLKYRSDTSAVNEIVDAVQHLLTQWRPGVEILVPTPASSPRAIPPVLVLAKAISIRMGIPLVDCVKKTRETQSLKNVDDPAERRKMLDGLYDLEPSLTRGKRVMVFDDLFRSGATMNAITSLLLGKGMAKAVSALAITKTRSNR